LENGEYGEKNQEVGWGSNQKETTVHWERTGNGAKTKKKGGEHLSPTDRSGGTTALEEKGEYTVGVKGIVEDTICRKECELGVATGERGEDETETVSRGSRKFKGLPWE